MDALEESLTSKKIGLRRALGRAVRFFYVSLIEPKNKNDDDRRREFIVNVILVGSNVFLCFLTIIAFFRNMFDSDYIGVLPEVPLIVLLIFAFLLVLSRSLLVNLAAFFLLALYYFAATYAIYIWGIDTPQALITYALMIVILSVLVSPKSSLIVSGLIFATLIFFGYFQSRGIFFVDSGWKEKQVEFSDGVEFSVNLGVILLVSWLSNREIRNSLERVKRSKMELKKERDLLEEKVKERTRNLEKVQYEKAQQLSRMAEFGRLSSGLFHDLSNYINVLFLNIDKMDAESKNRNGLHNNDADLERVKIIMNKLGNFVGVIHKQLHYQETLEVFSVSKEIHSVSQILSYKAIESGVEIELDFSDDDVYIFGDPTKFSQVVMNIISNAIDAYVSVPKNSSKKRKVEIRIEKGSEDVKIFFQDWGCGISSGVGEKIFDLFFTTKGHINGLGVGLSNVKEIIEKSFRGSIRFESKKGVGTIFVVTLSDYK